MLHTFGSHLDITALEFGRHILGYRSLYFRYFCEAFSVNTSLTHLNVSACHMEHSDAGFLSDAIKVNNVLANLNLSQNNIGASGAASL